MLKAIPKSWFSWDFSIVEGSTPVAEISVAWWRERGELKVRGSTFNVYREGPMMGDFVLESGGAVLARAEKPSAFRRTFLIVHEGRRYTLRSRSALLREFVLLDGSTEVGSIAPEWILTRRAAVSLPLDLPLPVRVFMIWLVLILWKRDDDSPGTTGPPPPAV